MPAAATIGFFYPGRNVYKHLETFAHECDNTKCVMRFTY